MGAESDGGGCVGRAASVSDSTVARRGLQETQLTIETCHLQATRENSEHSVKSGLKLLEKVQRSIQSMPQVTRESSEFGIKSMSQAARESSEFSSIKR